MEMMELPTPETDALDCELHNPRVLQDRYSEMMEHARKLERERDEAMAELANLESLMFGGLVQPAPKNALAWRVFDAVMAMKKERDEAREAIQYAIDSYKKVKWGYDGCCGTSVIMEKLQDFLSKEAK